MTEQKQIVNALCHSGIDTILSAGFIMLGKKFLKFKSPDPSKFYVNDIGLITISIAAADLTREYAVKKGWIPENLRWIPTIALQKMHIFGFAVLMQKSYRQFEIYTCALTAISMRTTSDVIAKYDK